MIVNEYRLDLTSPQGQKMMHEQAEKYFFGEGASCRPITSRRPQVAARRTDRTGKAAVRGPGDVVFVSCYEPGHQPQGVASAIAFVRRPVSSRRALDLAVEPWTTPRAARLAPRGSWRSPVPMHTALVLGRRVAAHVRRRTRGRTSTFRHVRDVNRALLAGEADSVLGPDSELQLVDLAESLRGGPPCRSPASARRQPALVPRSRRAAGAREVRAPRDCR